jgi:hypothetical protein
MTRALLTLALALFVSSLTVAVFERETSHELGSGIRVYASTSDTVTTTVPVTTTTAGSTRSVTARGATEVSVYRPASAEPAGDVWDRLAACESGGRWDIYNPPHEGGLQFHHATWDAYKLAGYPDDAHLATREQQIAVGEVVQRAQGWGAWPVCSRKIGVR